MSGRACVVGSGPNGLAAAIVLAQAGLEVEVLEAEASPGGAARSMELTLPGYLHDFGSAVYPLAVGSPFFSSLPLEQYGLEWIHSPAPLAHPLDDGTAVVLERDLGATVDHLGEDGRAWQRLMGPSAEHWHDFARDVLGPATLGVKRPWLMTRFGVRALQSAERVARRFRGGRARALFAGLAAHSFLRLDEPLSAAFGLLMGIAAHAVGWPIPRGGARSLTDALCRCLSQLGGTLRTSSPVDTLAALSGYDVVLLDVTPRQLLLIGGGRMSQGDRRRLARFRYGMGVFKVDYALSGPIPWMAPECSRAVTVHVGGTFEQIAAGEDETRAGRCPDRPFVLLAQPTLYDPSRAPVGRHIAWAYCHVPNGSSEDMLGRLERQIERFAPGFRDVVLARRVLRPAGLEGMDANLVGGDIGGGALDLRQFLFRPTRRRYATSMPGMYLCSASTPPGGGVHGMCGYHAARMALARWTRREPRG
jgi:phytoene dehydrogenase-like protein